MRCRANLVGAAYHPSLGTLQERDIAGDAIHVMSPTGGAGANTAPFGAAKLCAVLREGDITEAAIGEYENAMRGFARKAIEYSWEGGKRICPQLPFEEGKPLELN